MLWMSLFAISDIYKIMKKHLSNFMQGTQQPSLNLNGTLVLEQKMKPYNSKRMLLNGTFQPLSLSKILMDSSTFSVLLIRTVP